MTGDIYLKSKMLQNCSDLVIFTSCLSESLKCSSPLELPEEMHEERLLKPAVGRVTYPAVSKLPPCILAFWDLPPVALWPPRTGCCAGHPSLSPLDVSVGADLLCAVRYNNLASAELPPLFSLPCFPCTLLPLAALLCLHCSWTFLSGCGHQVQYLGFTKCAG